MNIKRTCQFLLDKEADKMDAKLRYRIKWNSNKNIVAFNVGYRVDIAKWSIDTQRCINNTTHGKKKVAANIINKEIQRFEQIADEVFEFFSLTGKIPKTEEFRSEFNKRTGRIQPELLSEGKTLFDIFDEYLKKMSEINQWTESTYTKHKAAKSHLEHFDKKLTFESITEDTLVDFIKYQQTKEAMQLRYKNSEMGMRNITIAKNMEYLKSFLKWAHKNKYYQGDLHETFKPKFKGIDGNSKEVIHLSWKELMYLYDFKFEQEYLERVRDVFCFCCFTSLRYSDVAKLRRSDIKENYIRVITKKTIDGLKIDLNKYSRAILDKYKNTEFPYDRVLPVISNTKMNEYLKTMGEVSCFTELIRIVYFIGAQRYEEVLPKYSLLTTHCGRRTFIVNSLYLGIPAEVVMSWTGHSDYDSMKPYIKIVDELKEMSMKKFDEKE
ncbi:MAG: site-specific integrase [Candidatus Symbiothrix sp.]|jgi:integrase|nr:site-specific integrase [Candidatus Symbiothrix sp.]